MGTELTPTHPRPALGKFGKQAIKHDRAVWPRREMTLPTHYSPVINNSQHRQPSVQPPLIHLLPPVSPAFVRRSRRSDAYPRFPPGLAVTREEDPRPPSTGSQKIGAAGQSQTLIGRHTFFLSEGGTTLQGIYLRQ